MMSIQTIILYFILAFAATTVESREAQTTGQQATGSQTAPDRQIAESKQAPKSSTTTNITQRGKSGRELSGEESLKCEEFQGSKFKRGYIEFSVPCSSPLFCVSSSEILRNYCKDNNRLVRYLCDPNQMGGWLTKIISCPKLCRSGKCI